MVQACGVDGLGSSHPSAAHVLAFDAEVVDDPLSAGVLSEGRDSPRRVGQELNVVAAAPVGLLGAPRQQ